MAGTGLDSRQREHIYDDMLAYRRFPADLFAGSDQRKDALRTAMRQPVIFDSAAEPRAPRSH